MATSQKDTEITLGTGRMLVLFFTFVLVCAVFFAIGFSLGRKTTMAGVGGLTSASGGSPATIVRPSAAEAQKKAGMQPTEFSFYKDVSSNSTNSGAAPSAAEPQAAQPQTQSSSAVPSGASVTPTSSPAITPGSATPAAGGYFVQVAAVSRQEDAASLVEALKKKQYPAFTVNNSSLDRFYHIQVGPYDGLKDAEAMRARLISDGYNPILKK